MRKWIKYGVLPLGAALVLGTGVLGFAMRDTAPRHASLVNKDLPGIIPLRDFYANMSAEWNIRASASGDYLSLRSTKLGSEVVLIRRREDGADLATFEDVAFHQWEPTGEFLRMYSKGRYWKIDPTKPAREDWIDVTPRSFSNWQMVDLPADPKRRVIVASADRTKTYVDIYDVAQDGTDRQLIARNEGKTLIWMFDLEGKPLLRQDKISETKAQWLFYAAGIDGEAGIWSPAFETDEFDYLHPLEATKDGAILALSNRGRDKRAFVRLDPKTGAEKVLVEDAHVDLSMRANLDAYDGEIDLLVANDTAQKLVATTPRGEAILRLIARFGPDVDLDGVHSAGAGRFAVLSVSPQAKGYETYLADLENETLEPIGTHSFRSRHEDKLSSTQGVRIPARDGMPIPAYLMMPKGAEGPVPFVVHVHGGPAHRNFYEYQHLFQLLANRGYGVLTVNYRGSAGYGRAFMEAGFGAYGAEMQDDIVDAAQWLIAEGHADKEAMAIMGGSYGGYASALAMTRDPGLFKAALVEHAVLDVEYQVRNNPGVWGNYLDGISRYFGALDSAEDVAKMKARSPQNNVENVQGAIQLIAGRSDRVVGFEQTEVFAAALEAAGKDVSVKIFDGEGHGLRKWQSKLQYARIAEDFLAEHLGGRSGGWTPFEWAAEYLE
ncbi:MAG: alpha/beta hydrolase family protein [Paracoccaceae bacterium]